MISFFEKQWIEKRNREALRPHEQAALEMYRRGHALKEAEEAYYKVSRFRLALAKKCKDDRTVQEIQAVTRDDRRALLIEARRRWKVALPRFFRAVKSYKSRRTTHFLAEDRKARSVPNLSAFKTLEEVRREYQRAWRALSKAQNAADRERFRVRDLYPPCPILGVVGEAEGKSLNVPATEENVRTWRDRGEVTAEGADKMIRELQQWQLACNTISRQNIDWSLIRAESRMLARYGKLDRMLLRVPTKSCSDVLAKLRFIAPDTDGPVREAIDCLIRDIAGRKKR